jgi:hypothetical protein
MFHTGNFACNHNRNYACEKCGRKARRSKYYGGAECGKNCDGRMKEISQSARFRRTGLTDEELRARIIPMQIARFKDMCRRLWT